MTKQENQVLVEDGAGNRFSVTGDLSEERLVSRGYTVIEDDLAVSRPRKRRTKADMKELIAQGVVADPKVGVPASRFGDGPDIEDRGDAVVFRPDSAAASGEGKAK